jgi:hypothetical protein
MVALRRSSRPPHGTDQSTDLIRTIDGKELRPRHGTIFRGARLPLHQLKKHTGSDIRKNLAKTSLQDSAEFEALKHNTVIPNPQKRQLSVDHRIDDYFRQLSSQRARSPASALRIGSIRSLTLINPRINIRGP